MKKVVFFITSVLLLAVYLAADVADAQRWYVRGRQASTGETYLWERLKIGSGGWAVGLGGISDDGVRTTRTDVSQGYVWGASDTQWRPCIKYDTMPSSATANGFGYGPWELVIAPSDSQRMYMFWGPSSTGNTNSLYRSDDQCHSWALKQTGLPTFNAGGNDSNRHSGQKIVVDPQNPDVVYVSAGLNGTYRSLNGGDSWAKVAAITDPNDTRGNAGMVIDCSAGTTTLSSVTVCKNVFIPSYGYGSWYSTDGGANFTQVSGGQPQIILNYTTPGNNRILYVTTTAQVATGISVSDTLGLTWTRRANNVAIGGTWRISTYWALMPTAGSTEITVTFNGNDSATFNTAEVISIGGANTSSPFDVVSPGTSATTPSLTTTSNDTIVFSRQVTGTGATSATAGWTCIVVCEDFNYSEYIINTSPGTFTATSPGSLKRGGYIDAIKATGPGMLVMDAANRVVSSQVAIPRDPYQIAHAQSCNGTIWVTEVSGKAFRWDGSSWHRVKAHVGANGPLLVTTSSASTTLTIDQVVPNPVKIEVVPGQTITGTGIPANTVITAQVSPASPGVWGYEGVYTTNNATTTSSTSVTATGNGLGFFHLIPDPNDCDRVWASGARINGMNQTTNATDTEPTWRSTHLTASAANGFAVDPNGIGWFTPYNTAPLNSIDGGDARFNKVTGELEWATGLCYYTADVPKPLAGFTYKVLCHGMETVVPHAVYSIPGGATFFCNSDVGCFANLSTTGYPAYGLPMINYVAGLTRCMDMQYSGQNPDFIVTYCTETNGLNSSGFTTTGGLTQSDWKLFGNFSSTFSTAVVPPGNGGGNDNSAALAPNACDTQNVLWAQVLNNGTSHGGIYRTTNAQDSGITWTQIAQTQFADTPTTGALGWGEGAAYYHHRHILVADKVACDTFYAFNGKTTNGANPAVGALWKSIDKGATWTKVWEGPITTTQLGLNIQSVYGKPGWLYAISGSFLGGGSHPAAGAQMMWSHDGGEHWAACPSIQEPIALSFGASAPGSASGAPSLIVNGYIGGVRGVFRSDDDCQTWTENLAPGSTQPVGDIWFQGTDVIGADMNEWGKIIAGQTWGSGWTQGTRQ